MTGTAATTTTGLGIAGIALAVSSCMWLSPIDSAPTTRTWGTLESSWNTVPQGTRTPARPQNSMSESTLTSAEIAQEIQIRSGLTAKELGIAFGVSRRSVHNWAAGARMSPQNEKRLRDFYRIIMNLPGDNPDDHRAELLDESHGKSIFLQFRESASRNNQTKAPVPILERIG